jgi:hypothetical protein
MIALLAALAGGYFQNLAATAEGLSAQGDTAALWIMTATIVFGIASITGGNLTKKSLLVYAGAGVIGLTGAAALIDYSTHAAAASLIK